MGLILNRRREMGGKTLPYDVEIEYLQSSGTQWIDTDVVPSSGLVTEIDFQYVSLINNTALFGAWDNIGYHCTLFSSRWYYCSFSGESNVAWRSGSPNTNRHKIKIDGHGGIYEDDVKIATTSESSTTMNTSIVIFARKNNGTIQTQSSIKCYGLKMYSSNGTLIRDMIPVRKGQVGYMYDKVSGTLFGNSGSGSFVLGPDVIEIEYLESTGTQVIDTGYTSNNVDSFELTIVTNGTSNYMGANGNLQVDLTISSGLGKRTIKVTHSANDGPNTYINGSLVKSQSFHTYNGYIIALFALGTSSSSVGHYSSAAVYSAQLTINGTLVRDFIPVRVGNVGYLYDKVSGELFGNAGTGDFVLGPDV